MTRSKILLILSVTAFVLAIWLIAQAFQSVSPLNSNVYLPPATITSPSPGNTLDEKTCTYLVTKVIDGDTFEIEGGEKVRLIGIDTPETVDPRRPVGCFGQEASNATKSLLEGKWIRMETDITDKDKYKRLLRYVWINNVFINEYLVRQGYALSYSYPPDTKYQGLFDAAEIEAQENKQGLWEKCKI